MKPPYEILLKSMTKTLSCCGSEGGLPGTSLNCWPVSTHGFLDDLHVHISGKFFCHRVLLPDNNQLRFSNSIAMQVIRALKTLSEPLTFACAAKSGAEFILTALSAVPQQQKQITHSIQGNSQSSEVRATQIPQLELLKAPGGSLNDGQVRFALEEIGKLSHKINGESQSSKSGWCTVCVSSFFLRFRL